MNNLASNINDEVTRTLSRGTVPTNLLLDGEILLETPEEIAPPVELPSIETPRRVSKMLAFGTLILAFVLATLKTGADLFSMKPIDSLVAEMTYMPIDFGQSRIEEISFRRPVIDKKIAPITKVLQPKKSTSIVLAKRSAVKPVEHIEVKWDRAIALFRTGAHTQACALVQSIVDETSSASSWWNKAQSFFERKCAS